jgi:hypothetical protein
VKKNRVTIICVNCGGKFEVIKCRENSAKTCNRKCYREYSKTLTPWNKGKSYNELYDIEKEKKIKSIQSNRSSGSNNPMYGKHHRDESKKKMSERKIGYKPWITGKKLPGLFKRFNRRGINNAYIKHVLKEENITYDEYLSRLTDKEKYYKEVIRITRLQNITVLENYEKRSKAPDEHAYNLDHIYPIIKGFENNIPPEIIGDISNLRFIPWKENLHKSDKLLEKYENSIPV